MRLTKGGGCRNPFLDFRNRTLDELGFGINRLVLIFSIHTYENVVMTS